jgi:hypothetical protein
MKKGKDYYIENGLYVFTAEFLAKRGYCCGNGCRHCPYPKTANHQDFGTNGKHSDN